MINWVRFLFLLIFFVFSVVSISKAANISVLSNGPTIVSEGNRQLTFTATLERVASDAGTSFTLYYQTTFATIVGESANPNEDYIHVNSNVYWAANESGERLINISILDDLTKEGSEKFTVSFISNDEGVTVNGNAGRTKDYVVTILDNETIVSDKPARSAQLAIAETINVVCPNLLQATDTLNDSQKTMQAMCRALNSANNEQAQAALQALSPEVAVSQNTVGRQLTQHQFNTIDHRLAMLRVRSSRGMTNLLDFSLNGNTWSLLDSANFDANSMTSGLVQKLQFFINSSLGLIEKSATAYEATYKPHMNNLTAGLDYQYQSDKLLGMALGLGNVNTKLGMSKFSVRGYNLMLFGAYQPEGALYANVAVHVGLLNYRMTRNISLALPELTQSVNAESDSGGNQLGVSVGAGNTWPWSGTVMASVSGQFNYLRSGIDAYEETGDQAYGVAIGAHSNTMLSSVMGSQLTLVHTLMFGVMTFNVGIDWVHEFRGGNQSIEGYFLNDPNQQKFNFVGDAIDEDYFNLHFSTTLVLPQGYNVFFEYISRRAQVNYSSDFFNVGFRKEGLF